MRDGLEHFEANADRLLERAFRMASVCELNHKSLSKYDFYSTEKDIPSITGLNGLIDSSYKDLRYYLRTGSTGCLANQSVSMLARIGHLSQAGCLDWRTICPTLEYLWGSFFSGSAVARDWPGFVILMPGGYVTSRHSFLQNGEQTKVPKPENVTVHAGSVLTLQFGRFWPTFDIPIAVKRMRLSVPPGREARWANPVVRHRVRYYVNDEGLRLPSETIFQVGRAAPDDEVMLRKGRYYPNTEGKRIVGPDGSVCFTSGMTVIVLARLVPNPSNYSAVIHQLSISLNTAMTEILDINCLLRSFTQFSKHYPGILPLIHKSLTR